MITFTNTITDGYVFKSQANNTSGASDRCIVLIDDCFYYL